MSAAYGSSLGRPDVQEFDYRHRNPVLPIITHWQRHMLTGRKLPWNKRRKPLKHELTPRRRR